MGNNQPAKEKEGTHEYERFGWVQIKEVNDTSTQYRNQEKQELMQFSRPVESEKVYKDWQQEINRIDDSESRDVLLLPTVHQFEKAGLCGSAGHVNLAFENFPYVLDGEIKNRKKMSRYFLQTEMWYLLYNIIRVGNKFQKIGKKVGDINPHNIVINDDGQIKVVSTCSLPNQQNNFQKIIENKNAVVYLAPQQLNQQAISSGHYPSNVDPCKAQVFSIGLTILSSGILEDCFEVYSKGIPRTINEQLLNEYIGMLTKNYSPYLFNTIVSMLVLQPNARRKASEIYNELYPFENQLLDLQPFQPLNQSITTGSQFQMPTQIRQTVISGYPQVLQYMNPYNSTLSSQYGGVPQRVSNYQEVNSSGYRRPV